MADEIVGIYRPLESSEQALTDTLLRAKAKRITVVVITQRPAVLNAMDKLLVLRKPFEPVEVQQCAAALCQKWQNERLIRNQVSSLEKAVAARTRGLEAAYEAMLKEKT